MTREQRNKIIAIASSLGLSGIAGGLVAISSGKAVGCDTRTMCQRVEENALSELLCPTPDCARSVQAGYREIAAQCADFKPSDCSLEKRP